jgi:radical SAM protein with 4Fe4S-binding SPASM domain
VSGTTCADDLRWARVRSRFWDDAVPVSGGIEPTRRCNLRCVHCYVGGERTAAPPGRLELETAAWLALLDEMAAAGCLDLLITGGEPLLRPDFTVLYARARERGMLVTLFSNGTLVEAETIDLLRDLPPLSVEVSMYGATAATHERVTGVPGSFEAARRGLDLLAGAGIPLTVKTMLMSLNSGEIDALAALAREYGARWRLDPALSPRLDGDRAPLALRVPAAEAARRELGGEERTRRWREQYERGLAAAASERLYTCGAGVTNFHVDPCGVLLPCVMAKSPARDLRREAFVPAWRALVADIAALRAPEGYPCNDCDKRDICGLCPPFAELESGSPAVPPAYLCELGDRRKELLYARPDGEREA